MDPGLALLVALGNRGASLLDGRAFDRRIVEASLAARRTMESRAWTEVPGRAMVLENRTGLAARGRRA
jgi:hypothetical protein